ncbi:MAG: hypothetical protein CBC29_06815 [Methylococcaceae bacterium TMED69]|nr:MAG: hypothetical protein CBC29_06815 [Methylococcaceae bacterium TMED69]|tara:strand:+ start:1054 stop:1245 length:192 start_codon:yes stop_codon:yes gene_type:complete
MQKLTGFIKDKKFISGLAIGYLVTSWMNWDFPGIYFWCFLASCLFIGSWIYCRWSKMNEDYYD